MGTITFTNRTSEIEYEGELKDVLRDLSQNHYLRNAYLPQETMVNADMHEAKLPFVTFAHSDLSGTNFKGAILRYANLKGCDLRNCNFEGADLEGANFTLAAIQGASFKGAYMKGIKGIDLPAGALDEVAPKPEDMPSVHHWK